MNVSKANVNITLTEKEVAALEHTLRYLTTLILDLRDKLDSLKMEGGK